MLLSAKGSVFVCALVAVACGGSAPPPAATPPAPPPSTPLEPKEAAPDLSPVGAPAGLFAVGRWQRPVTQIDTLGSWLGIPGHVLDFAPERYQGLVRAIDADAPVEFAAVLTRGKGSTADWVVSIGLRSLAQAVEEARQQGAEVAQKAPGIFSVELGRHFPSCAVALSLGRAPARLVCSSNKSMLDAELPFATRGLPTLKLGSRDLELELRLAPVREGYEKELAGAAGFGTFIARQLEVDSPRLDRATSEAVRALLDEILTFSSDLDVVALGGNVDDTKGELSLDVDLKFREQKSFFAGMLQDASHQGPPPDGFFSLPAAAESGGYSRGFDKTRWTGVRTHLTEIVDAFLEHEKVGKPARDRARRIVDNYFDLSGARSMANAPASADGAGGYTLQIIDGPTKSLVDSFADMNGLIGDQKVRGMLAKRLGIPDKSLPKASLVPLKGTGIPAGTRAFSIKVPKEFYAGMRKLFMSKLLGPDRSVPASSSAKEPPALAFVALPRGTGTLVAMATTPAELSKLLVDFLNGKLPTLRERPELLRFERMSVAGAYFVTLSGIVAAIADSTGRDSLRATGSAASIPLFFRYEVQPGWARFGVTVPKGMFGGVQSLIPGLIR